MCVCLFVWVCAGWWVRLGLVVPLLWRAGGRVCVRVRVCARASVGVRV